MAEDSVSLKFERVSNIDYITELQSGTIYFDDSSKTISVATSGSERVIYGKNKVYVGDIEPTDGSLLWLDTSLLNGSGANIAHKVYQAVSSTSQTLVLDTVYQWTSSVNSLTITLPIAPTDNSNHEIILKFQTGSTPTITWPSALKWANGEPIDIEGDSIYEFSIGFDWASRSFTIVGTKFA